MSILGRVRNRLNRYRRTQKLEALSKRCAAQNVVVKPYQLSHLFEVNETIGWKDKNVLEIGGDLAGQVARGILALGARGVTSINLDPDFDLSAQHEGIVRKLMDARNLELPENSYDLVFGIAVVEHFREFDRILENVYRVTKPGGHVYLCGGPLWFSPKGHHLVVTGTSGAEYHFRSNNVIDDWHHLLCEPDELCSEILKEGVPPQDAADIVDYVFNSELINRNSWQEILNTCKSSNFVVDNYKLRYGVTPSAPLAGAIEDKLGVTSDDLRTSGIDIVMRKP